MCFIKKPEKITTERPQREKAEEPLTVHNVWLLFDVYLHVVTNLKLCWLKRWFRKTKQNTEKVTKKRMSAHDGIILIRHTEKNRLPFYMTIGVTYFSSRYIFQFSFIKSINYEFRKASARMRIPHSPKYSYFKNNIEWYTDQMIECKQRQNWKATL